MVKNLPAKQESESEVTQSCLTLCHPMDCSLPGSSIHGILQARILEWVAISFSRGIFLTQGSNPGLLHCRQTLYPLSHQGSLPSRRPGFDPWVRKIPWRRKWHDTPVFFPGKSHGRRSLSGYSPWGRKESDRLAKKQQGDTSNDFRKHAFYPDVNYLTRCYLKTRHCFHSSVRLFD